MVALWIDPPKADCKKWRRPKPEQHYSFIPKIIAKVGQKALYKKMLCVRVCVCVCVCVCVSGGWWFLK